MVTVDIEDLKDKYGAGYVETAFKLQNHLYENGYRGIEFEDAIESHLRRTGPMVVKRKVESEMKQAVRRYNVG